MNNNFVEYFKTFLITLLGVVIVVIFFAINMVHNIYNADQKPRAKIEDELMEPYLIDLLINKNIYLSDMYPKNYTYNLKLGILYGYKKEYKKSEKELINSITKARNGNYIPVYRLALLYVNLDRLQEAQALMDDIGEKPNKKLIEYKGDVYLRIGDKFFEQGYYALAASRYEKAYSYYKKINKKVKLKTTKENLLSSYVALADKYVENMKIEDAIDSLEKAYEIEKVLLVEYKLGLLLMDNNPKRAYELLSSVHKKDPKRIDSDVYYNFLRKLGQSEIEQGNPTEGELLYSKAETYRSFIRDNILYNKDLFVDVTNAVISCDKDKKAYNMSIQMRIQNNSGYDINNLSLNVVFRDDGKIIQVFSQKIFGKGRILKAGDVTPAIVVNAVEDFKNEKKRKSDITVDVYAFKYPKYRIHLTNYTFKKPDRD